MNHLICRPPNIGKLLVLTPTGSQPDRPVSLTAVRLTADCSHRVSQQSASSQKSTVLNRNKTTPRITSRYILDKKGLGKGRNTFKMV